MVLSACNCLAHSAEPPPRQKGNQLSRGVGRGAVRYSKINHTAVSIALWGFRVSAWKRDRSCLSVYFFSFHVATKLSLLVLAVFEPELHTNA